ncbi:MAG: crossover junction endodeoxyribonuclease RuvC [Chitinophagales bacterium]|nr:MAG: crossover junction endodeoxyribonuclease RuvC [Chitinophagales bacterium]
MPAPKETIILGIDPGTAYLGYGIIRTRGSQLTLISIGTVELTKVSPHLAKLKKIFERVTTLIRQHKPDVCAIEAPFYGKNVQSMLKLGRAQGVAISAVLLQNLPITEYSPKKVKLAVTGNGNASKEQVAGMVQQILQFDQMPKYKDATDGLAVALCHYFQMARSSLTGQKIYKDWKEFVQMNPTRL